MASCQTSRWQSTSPYVRLTVNETASTASSVTLSWVLEYYSANAGNTTANKEYSVTIGGSTVASGAYDIDGKTGWNTIKSGTKTIAKTTSAQTISFGISFAFNMSWSGVYCGTRTASGSIAIAAALSSYTISYNANGGGGAPSSQTKWHGETLVLSSTKPTRTGYTFQGWALSKAEADNSTWYYQPGGNCAKNENLTLYAVWKANTYTVSYNANGGSGAPANQTKLYEVALTLSSTKPTRTNYIFKGWGTSASATTVTYAAGSSYTANSSVTLYAIWALNYTKPRITNVSVHRCTSDGTADDNGIYAKVVFSWACDKTISSIKIEWKLSSDSNYSSSESVSASGTSGDVSQVIGAGTLSTDNTYDIRITVTDDGGSSSLTRSLAGTKFVIDLLSGGDGISFGKPAELSGYMDVGFATRFRHPVYLDNSRGLFGKTTSGDDISIAYVNSNDNTLIGYGGYANSIGQTNLYGNKINLVSKGDVYVNECRIAANKVLWSGGWYMNSSHTITLSEAVSKQANGIMLVWSFYYDDTDTVADESWNMCFVPKHFIDINNSGGMSMSLFSSTGHQFTTKYLYISDTQITGHSENNANPYTTNTGILKTPRSFVLRYVIGV